MLFKKHKKVLILQHDERDCGAACLAMIAGYYGLKIPIAKVREYTKTDRAGTNMYGMVDGARQIGLEAEGLEGDYQELLEGIETGEIIFPFVAHTLSRQGMLHFVVVYGKKRGKWILADPGLGRRKVTEREFAEMWTGNICTYRVTPDFHPGNLKKGSFTKFFSLLRGQYGRLAGVLLISVIVAAIGILGTFVFKLVIDNFAGGADIDMNAALTSGISDALEGGVSKLSALTGSTNFRVIFLALIGLDVLSGAITMLRSYLIMLVSRKIDIELCLDYYTHLMDLPMSSLNVRQTGEYLSRFSDTGEIRSAVSGATLTLILDGIMVIGSAIVLFNENPKLFCISMLIMLANAIVMFSYKRPIERFNRQLMEHNAVVQSYFKESVDGASTVKATCAGEQVKNVGSQKFKDYVNASFRFGLLSMSQSAILSAVQLIGTVGILWAGFTMVLNGIVSVGGLMTFYALLSYFTSPVMNLIGLQPQVQAALVAADRLNDILQLPDEEISPDAEPLPVINEWELKNVDFRYGNRELTLHDVSFRIKKGQKIAFVGESGSGKTTITRLLLRFYEPESGEVLLDGENIQQFDPVALRRAVAYVDQNTFLFADTVKNNLTLGCTDATDEDIAEACRLSRADDFISRLPMGLNMPLDENGANLSGGQRQRLAIARALLKKPQLLILDEASSNLDTVTESAIRDAIFALDTTCIVIAHRLSTVKSCDEIYVLDSGKIVEHGRHEELLAKNGRYAELWNRQ